MPFVSSQTYCNPPGTPLSTNWVVGTGLNSSFQVGVPVVGGSPAVGSYLVYQSPSVDVGGAYKQYTNNIAVTNWNQYTIEGYVQMLPKNSWVGSESLYSIYIGAPTGTSYIRIFVQPNRATSQQIIFAYYYYNSGANNFPIGSTSGLISNSGWVYYTLVKQSNNQRFLMINGALVGSVSSTEFTEVLPTTTGVALQFGVTTGNTLPPMCVDMHRISNIARYTPTQTFTPPTTVFANDVNTWFLSSFENTWTPAPSPT
jgi:hypothetical protein